MNKYIKIVSFLFLTLKITIIGQEFDTSVIKGASYCVKKSNFEENISTHYYYTFDGKYLTKISYAYGTYPSYTTLDQTAPKPQPTYYKIKYYGGSKGSQGDRIYFYDKNENLIAWYWYGKKEKVISRIRETFYISKKTGELYSEKEENSRPMDERPKTEWFRSFHICNYYQFPIKRTVFTKAYPDFPLDLSVVQENVLLEIKDWNFEWSGGAHFFNKYRTKYE